MVKISLTKEQVRKVDSLAEQRHNAKRKSFRNKSFMKIGAKGDFVAPHRIGLLGEMAYSVFTGLKVNEEIYDVSDDSPDFSGVEVKTITYLGPYPELKIKIPEFERKSRRPSLYVLARVDKSKPHVVELLGQISRERFEKLKKVKRYWGQTHENFVVSLKHMEPVSEKAS